ncbi:MAG: ABC transporter ATP-binding protein [bacterium]|jgi:lipoprotein-releasing system ATP-binding protein
MHLQLENLHKSYLDGEGRTLHILRGVDLRLEQPGQTVAIVGASGTGKSTLLHLIGLLDQPDQGRVLLDDKDLSLLSRDAQARYRNTQLGFIFQFHQLLQDFSALENVMMPALVQGQSHSQSRKRASELLEQVGLGERLLHKPSQLSGGEQQRVAIARALTNRPRLLLADEPTGNLDQENESQVLDTLLRCCADGQTTMLMITHNPQLATTLQQCYRLQDGRLQLDSSP